jgi:hypothetical protein
MCLTTYRENGAHITSDELLARLLVDGFGISRGGAMNASVHADGRLPLGKR